MSPGKRLTIFCSESDRSGHHPLARVVVERAREQGMAGVTVLRGIEGFGASSHLHTTRILSLAEELPIVIELVDTESRIRAFLPVIDELLDSGLVVLEDVDIAVHRTAHPGSDG